MDDEVLGPVCAREKHVLSTVTGISNELKRSGAPAGALEELAKLLVLVNKNDLRRLTAQHAQDWSTPGSGEIQERTLLKFLGKAGVGA